MKRPDRFLAAIILAMSMHAAAPMSFHRSSGAKSALDLLILHNNDMHARFEQTDKSASVCHSQDIIANKCYGGFARVSHLLKQYRSEADLGGPAVLYLNAGDTYTGTPWFTIFKDRIVSEFMNILKPDAISLGNHELDLGVSGLVPFLNDVNFPVLVANLNITADHRLWQTSALKKSVVFDIKGSKVGVIGYLTPDTKFVAIPNDLEFIPEVVGINEEAEALRNKGVNIIIALGHSGYQADKDIAKNCPLVDIVIGGHSNTFLYTGEQPDAEKIDGPYPTVIEQPSGKQVPVVQAYAFTKYLGELELSFDEDGNLLHWGGAPILLNGSIPRDPDVLALLDKYRPAILELTDSTVGVTKVILDQTVCHYEECNIGNLISDAFIYTRVNQYNGTRWTDASVALVQCGGIRSSSAVGIISKFDLKSILPFNNTIIALNMTGTALFQALEHSVKQFTGDRGEFLQMSGIRVVYDMNQAPGHRVKSAEVRCSECVVPSYSKIETDQMYGVLISDFLYNGGDGFTMFKEFGATDLNISNYDALLQYVKDMQIIYPVVEGRIKMIPRRDNPEPASASQSSASIVVILLTALSIIFIRQ